MRRPNPLASLANPARTVTAVPAPARAPTGARPSGPLTRRSISSWWVWAAPGPWPPSRPRASGARCSCWKRRPRAAATPPFPLGTSSFPPTPRRPLSTSRPLLHSVQAKWMPPPSGAFASRRPPRANSLPTSRPRPSFRSRATPTSRSCRTPRRSRNTRSRARQRAASISLPSSRRL